MDDDGKLFFCICVCVFERWCTSFSKFHEHTLVSKIKSRFSGIRVKEEQVLQR